MTLPNQAAGLADTGLEYAFTDDGSIPGAANRTQAAVTAQLKADMGASAGWNSATETGFGGLPAGTPLVVGIIAKIAEQFTGIPVSNWVNQWGTNPISSFIGTVIQDALAAIFTVSANMQALFENLDFLDPEFYAPDSLYDWALYQLGELGLFPVLDLVTGLIPGFLIPGLDASKIVTGTMPQDRITDLSSNLAEKLATETFDAINQKGTSLASDPKMSVPELWKDTLDASLEISGEQGYWGATSLKMTALRDGPDWYPMADLIRSAAGNPAAIVTQAFDKFEATIYVRADSGNSDTKSAYLQTLVEDSKGINPAVITQTGVAPATTFWKKIRHNTTVPTGYDTIRFRAYVEDNSTVGDFYYWDTPLIRETTKPDNLLEFLFGGQLDIQSVVEAGVIPGLDASKITTGSFTQGRVTDLEDDLAANLPREVFDAIKTGGLNIASDPTMGTASLWNDTTIESYAIANIGYWGFKSLEMTCLIPASYPSVWFIRDSHGDPAALIVNEGDKFDFSCRVRSHSDNQAGRYAVLEVKFRDSTGVLSATTQTSNTVIPPVFSWALLNMDVVVPDGYDTAEFRGYVQNTVTVNDRYYWDAPFIYESTKPTNLAEALFGQKQLATTIQTSAVPGLDASKIITGTFDQSLVDNLVDDLNEAFGTADTAEALLQAGLTSGTNLIPDPGFEQTSLDAVRNAALDAEWVYDGTRKHTGTRSLKCEFDGVNANLVLTPSLDYNRYMPTKEGQVYYLSQWIWADSGNVGNFAVEMRVRANDAAGASLAVGTISSVPAPGGWVKQEGFIVMPADAVEMRPIFAVISASQSFGDTFWLDDVELYEVTDAILLNQALYQSNTPGSTISGGAVPILDQTKVNNLTTDLDAKTPREVFDAIGPGGKNAASDPTMSTASLWDDTGSFATYAISSSVGYWGFKSLELTVVTPASYPHAHFIRNSRGEAAALIVAPGDKFDFSCYMRRHSGNSNTSVVLNVQVLFTDSTGVLSQDAASGSSKVASTSWQKLSMDVEVPDGYDTAAFRVYVDDDSVVGDKYYIDTPTIRETTKPTNIMEAIFGQKQVATTIISDAVPELDASKVTTGDFAQARVTGLEADINSARINTVNLATNPGYENSNFYIGTYANYTTDQAHSGTQCAQVNANGLYTSAAVAPGATGNLWLPTSPNDVYYCEFWVRGKSTNANTGGAVRLVIATRRTDETVIAYYTSVGLAASPDLNDVWTKVSGYCTILSSEAAEMLLYLECNTAVPAPEVYYFDDVKVYRVTEASQINQNLYGANEAAAAILASAVPTLDQTKIDGLTAALDARVTSEIFNAITTDNMASDPDMVTAALWTGSDQWCTTAITGDESYSGATSLEVTATDVEMANINLVRTSDGAGKYTPCREDDGFLLSVLVRQHASNSPQKTARVMVQFSDSKGVNGNSSQTITGIAVPDDDWVELAMIGTCPAGRDRVRFLVQFAEDADVGDILYVDRPVVRNVTGSAEALAAAEAAQAAADAALPYNAFDSYLSGGNNVVNNPSFEDSSLYLGEGDYVTEQKRTGAQSLKLTADGGTMYARLLSNKTTGIKIQVDPVQRFYVEYWVYGKSTNTGSGSANIGCVGLWGYNGGSYVVARALWFSADDVGKSSWVKRSGVVGIFPDDEDIDSAYIYAHFNAVAPVDDVYYFDDVVVKDITEAYAAQATADSAVSAAATAASDAQTVADNLQTLADNTEDDISTVQDEAALAQEAADNAQDAADELLADLALMSSDFENLVAGSDFEGDNPWPLVDSSMYIATAQSVSGTNALRLAAGPAFTHYKGGKIFSANPGDQVYVEFWARCTTLYDAEDNVNQRFRMTKASNINHTSGFNILFKRSNFDAVNTWQKFSAVGTVAEGEYGFAVGLYSLTEGTSGYVDIDDIVVRRIKPADIIAELPQTKVTNLPSLSTGVFKKFASGPNMVVDPTFTDIGQWACTTNHASGVLSSAQSHSASQSYKVTLVGSGGQNILFLNSDSRAITWNDDDLMWKALPGQTYYIEAQVYWPSSNTNTTDDVYLRFATVDSTGSNGNSYPTVDTFDVGTGPYDEWVKLSGVYTIPEGMDRIAGYMRVNGADDGDVLYIDDVVVKDVTDAYNAQLDADLANTTIEGVAASSNMIISPNFEDSSITRIPWSTDGSFAYTTAEYLQGSQCLSFTNDAGEYCGVYLSPTQVRRNFAVKPGQTYRVKVWVKPDASNNMSSGSLRLYLRSRQYDNGSGSWSDMDQVELTNPDMVSGWQEIVATGTVPDGRASLDVMILAHTSTPDGNVYYLDSVSLENVTDAYKMEVRAQDFDNFTAGSTNQWLNHQWQTGDDGWGNEWGRSAIQARSGTVSLMNDNTSGNTDATYLNYKPTVTEGEEIYWDFWIYLDSSFNGGNVSKLRFGGDTNGHLQSVRYDLQDDSEWVHYTGSFIVPAGVQELTISIWANQSAGRVFIDDLQIGRIKSAVADTITQGWYNDTGSGRGLSDLFDAIRQSKRNQDEIAAGLAALQADQNAGAAGGKSIAVTVSDTASIPPSFTKVYNGAGGVEYSSADGGTVRYDNSTGTEYWCHSDSLLTAYQEVSLLITKQSGWLVGERSVYFIARRNGNKAVICRLNGDQVEFGHTTSLSSGGFTSLSGPHTIELGSYMTFRCGVSNIGANPLRVMQIRSNNVVQKEVTLSSAVDTHNSGKGWGFGIQNQYDFLVNYSAYISQFYSNDNEIPAIPGTGATMKRLDDSSSISISSGTNALPNTFWDSVAESSPDIACSTSNGTFTVSDAGWYTFIVRMETSSLYSPQTTALILYVDGSPYRMGGKSFQFGYSSSTHNMPDAIAANWRVPLSAGAVVKIGYEVSSGTSYGFLGDSAGLRVYFTCSKGDG